MPYLLHNPRCSKSRGALALLQERGVAVRELRYLDTPLSATEIDALLARLGSADPRALMRTGEALYAELGLDDPQIGRGALVDAMARHPRLIERPVFVHGDRAVVGRPPERVLELLGD
ncbi:arsenate reductase (glutaredoxin) [Coralloluteibacterium stylophorae]|uniref:Arsenate reductase n=1 Tax=Coralloluteibacterium stylophorae TaxID=1776034 RepID=A0A8J7VSR8_9GAMM|nr:arsenate reductase (glutaredoxin) [Coralloluteibacterium stylophorae]MBS7455807.1 arsenate reductase (glutaredoxin) [Coralloluteibacterium stylophorae]